MKPLNQNPRRTGAGRSKPLEFVYRPIEQLKPDAATRGCTRKQIRQIANSIETFGFNVPILVDADLNVICGHGRLRAGRELGMTEVPTLSLDHLTPAQARAFMIADNRLTEIATWDDRLLAEQLRDLSLSGLDFSLEVTGFEMGEIDLRITSLEDPPLQEEDPADVVPEVAAGLRSAKSEINGFSGDIASYAAPRSIPRRLPR
jgi:ParB-like chromosome segregation protein Spo0J